MANFFLPKRLALPVLLGPVPPSNLSHNCCVLMKLLTCISNECVVRFVGVRGQGLSVHLVVEMAKNNKWQDVFRFEK